MITKLIKEGLIRSPHRVVAVVASMAFVFMSSSASAFWLLGFSDALTLPRGALGAIAGTGAQFTQVGAPPKDSSTVFIPHAGFRYGITNDIDLGYRLTQVALPFSSVGPTLGSEIDAKYRITSPDNSWQASIVGGLAYASLNISDQSKSAWSPGADLIVSHVFTPQYTLFSELRYVDTVIPTATGGSGSNYVNAAGMGLGFKIKLTSLTSIVPEIGVFNLAGKLLNSNANGFAVQAGVVLSIRIW